MSNKRILAFTLVELLVVLAIIALLVAILIPALNSVKERANRVKCMTHLRGIGQAMYLYGTDNKGQYPRVIYSVGQAPNYFNADRDPDPFQEGGVQVSFNDVTAGMFLLVRKRMLPLQIFLCPSASQQLDYVEWGGIEIPPTNRSNFSSKKPLSWSLSYAFASQYPDRGGGDGDSEAEYKHAISAPKENALAADRNDGEDRHRTVNPEASRDDIKAMNSRNHRKDGQNVLFNDGSVLWSNTPFVGYARDHIYVRAGGNPRGRPGIPANKHDSVLGPYLPLSTNVNN
jgi:prepilin-type N-terminal cleavage/methylation domain-containing protein